MSRLLVMLLTVLPLGGTPPTHPEVAATSVLGDWDAARARAWAAGRPGELRALYTPGSLAGRHDRAMLRAWQRRGLVVRGLRMQLLSVRTVRRSARVLVLDVVDRVTGGLAVGDGVREPLPLDAPREQVVRLRLVDGTWRVAAVSSAG